VSFSALFVCICVLYYCHRVATQLQLNISYQVNEAHLDGMDELKFVKPGIWLPAKGLVQEKKIVTLRYKYLLPKYLLLSEYCLY